MRVTVAYDSGRLDVFDDARFTAPQPFGGGVALANYELRLDCLGQTGLWLHVHHYDVGTAAGSPGDGIPKASRNKGWRFLLAERDEVDHVEQVRLDERELAFRVGGELVDAARFRQMVDLCVSDAARKSKAQCARELFETLSRLPGFSAADPAAVAAEFGFGLRALDAALEIEAAAGRCREGGAREAPADWMEGVGDEEAR